MRPYALTWLLACALLLLATGRAAEICTNVCSCKWKNGKRTVECREKGLTSVPDGLDSETQVLDVSENAIRALTSNVFVKLRLTNLQKLYLRNCHLGQIAEDAFAGLTNLVELDLSHNRLDAVPTKSFSCTPFLRDLSLSHNPLGDIPTQAFVNTPTLVKLDLSHAEITELAPKGFLGLDTLETLKLSHNKIVSLHAGTFTPLTKLTSIELHENPWICDCHLREMKTYLINQNLPTLISPVCHQPEQLVNRSFAELALDDFACHPVMLIASRYAEATIGENASIVCTVTAIPPAKVKWVWNGKHYTNHSAVNSFQKILINEEGTFRKRNTLTLTNAQETDSSNFFCIAENPAGSVEANFTLHVSLRTAGISTLGSGQIAGISAALVVLILVILLIIMALFVRLRRMPQKDVKSPAPASDNLPLDSCSSGGGGGTQDPNNPQSATSTVSRRKAMEEIETSCTSEIKSVGFAQHQQQRPGANNLDTTTTTTGHHDYLINRGYEETNTRIQQQQPIMMAGPCYPAQGSLMAIDNPDLIRDTRRGSNDDGVLPLSYASGEYSRLMDVDDGKFLYSECLSWEAQSRDLCGGRPSVSVNPYSVASKEVQLTHGSPILAAGLAVQHQHQQQQLQQQQQHHHQQLQQQHHQQQQQQAQEPFPPGAKQIRVWQKGVPVLPPVSALKRVLGSTRSSPDEGYQEGTGTDV